MEKFFGRYGLLLVIAIASIRFIFVGGGDINGWDEGLYAIKTYSIIANGDWLDQTEHSAGGFYTSVHPPLFNWLSALSVKFFGETTFAYRIWSAVFSCFLFVLIYILAGKGRAGIIASLALASSPSFNHYSIQGQLDILYIFFSILSIFFFLKHESLCSRGDNIKREGVSANKFLYMSGASFGLALMSKALVGFIVPIVISIYFFVKIILNRIEIKNFHLIDISTEIPIKQSFKCLSIISLIGLAIAVPWHVALVFSQGWDAIVYLFDFHLLKRVTVGVEQNIKPLGPFYYINQLFVQMSFYLPLLLLAFNAMKKDFNKLLMLLLLSGIPLIIFSLSSTKIPSYLLIVLPAVSILAGIGIDSALKTRRIPPMLFTVSSILFLWSVSQTLRDYVQDNLKSHFLLFGGALTALALLLYLFFRYLDKSNKISKSQVNENGVKLNKSVESCFSNKLRCALAFSILFIMISFNFGRAIVNFSEDNLSTRIDEAAEYFFENDFKRLIYIDPARKAEVSNPQVTFYFRAVDLGWDSNVTYTYVRYPDIEFFEIAEGEKTMVVMNRRTCKHFYPQLEQKLNYEMRIHLNSEDYSVWISE